MNKKKYVFKILVAGQGGVGKTTLLNRIVTGKFVQNTAMTIGVEFHLLNVLIGDSNDPNNQANVQTTLQLWDFGGQERFRFMLDSYVAGARGALLLYDLTRLRTLDNLEEWVNIVRKQDPTLPILFVGTKLDRVEDITVADDYAKTFLEPLKMFDHVKISSKDGTGVKRAFELVTRKVLEINGVQLPPDNNNENQESSNVGDESKPFTPPGESSSSPFTPPSRPKNRGPPFFGSDPKKQDNTDKKPPFFGSEQKKEERQPPFNHPPFNPPPAEPKTEDRQPPFNPPPVGPKTDDKKKKPPFFG
ncbi:MAG: Rab family GTPase [Promethearchaeota archaeon]